MAKKKSVAHVVALFTICSLLLVAPVVALPLEQIISRRQSVRSYTDEKITIQQLLKILWATYGSSNVYRSIPNVGDNYPLIVFPVNATGSYRYFPENHSIILHDGSVNKETIRPHDSDWPSDAPFVLVVVWNRTKMGNQYFASAEVGCLVQNVYLAAASLDLGTCCVGLIDSEGLRDDLTLPSTLAPLLVMPLGHPASPYPEASPNYDLMTGNLPPVQYSELSFEDALKNILFAREWSAENLSLQELSQLLWSAYGYTNVTYKTTYHRTTPSAHGIYPLVIFVSNATGVYQYLPENHSVTEILHSDKRLGIANACSGQVWAADAPATFLIVYNSSYNGGNTGDGGTLPHEFIEVDAGAAIQQLFLEASAWNLSANIVSEGLEEWNGIGAEELRNILDLSPSLIPLYTIPVGVRAPDTTPPTIGTPFQNPDPAAVEPNQNVTVSVEVTDKDAGVREVVLSYSIDEGQTWTNTTMNHISMNTYTGEIPGFEKDTHVQYKIIAYNNANNPAVEDNAENYYVYTVIPELRKLIIFIFITATLIVAILTKIFKQPQLPRAHPYDLDNQKYKKFEQKKCRVDDLV
ncbi:MAG: nitroreductase family protein [Candidatus Bathyarchaeota archaeon]|nr:nitroreductase family protein [Candidatus Bathyarchaeota archaeon]